MWGPMWGSSDW